jgi:hypothetical protein
MGCKKMSSDALLFRFTNTGDTISEIAASEKIIFNPLTTDSPAPDLNSRLVYPRFRMPRNVSRHPNPNRALNRVIDNKLNLQEVILSGYFRGRDTALGPQNLRNWQIDDSETDDFEFGRFGLVLNSFNGILNVTPSVTQGYELVDVEIEDVPNPAEELGFTIKLDLNGTPETTNFT